MKLFLLSIIFVALSSLSFGQGMTLTEFAASDGLTSAASIAGEELESPVLIGIGAANTAKMMPNLTLDASYNLETGKSKGWIYAFASSTDTSKTTIVPLIKVFGNYLDIRSVMPNLSFEGIEFPTIPIQDPYKSAEEFAQWYNSFATYNDLKSTHTEASFEMMSLNANFLQDGTISPLYWWITYTDTEHNVKFLCKMDASTGEGECQEAPTSDVKIKYTMDDEIKVYPQPANNEIIVNLKENYNSFKVVDLFGVEYDLNNQLLLNNDLLNIDISNLKTGTYFLILENANSNNVVKFIKN